ncbi:MAG: bactofilin family protein [Nitrospiraceae bacterium]
MWKQKSESKDPNTQSEQESEDTDQSASGPKSEAGEEVIAFVGKGVEFKGTISYSGTVRIDGYLDGEIHTEGILLVGEEAAITAKVTAGTIVCKGKITGDVTAKEKIKLRAPAVFSGSVKTPMLSIEEGVMFNGNLEMAQPAVREFPREATLHSVGGSAGSGIKRISG